MHFSWDISFGTLLSIGVYVTFGVPFFIRMGKLLQIYKDYPPHRHYGTFIVYPRGMDPDRKDSK